MPIKLVLNKGKVPVKIYTHEVESHALDQLTNISKLPFIHSHIAAMPDVHMGIGATIGSVIPTKGAIIPAAIGVDIGCFIGETKIPLLNGTQATLKELAEQKGEHWIYSIDKDQKITGAKATAKLTRKNASLMRIVLDNDTEILCTPDHQFMLRDGKWCEAKNLQTMTSLMPFYSRTDNDGYRIVKQPVTGTKQRFHWSLARSGILGDIPSFKGQKTIIHHIDFNESNNHPNNLMFMGNGDHSSYHRSLVERNTYWQSPEFEMKRKAALAKKAKTIEGHEYFAKRGSKNITRYMTENPEHFKMAVADNGKRGRTALIAYNKSTKGRTKSRENAQRLLLKECECPDCGIKIQGHLRLNSHKRFVHGYNHKVKSVEFIEQKADVYCLTVPEYGNFALSAGVFVHNCGMNATRLSIKAKDLPDSLKKVRLAIEEAVPVGFAMHKSIKAKNSTIITLNKVLEEKILPKHPTIIKMMKNIYRTWTQQLGSLGGGNHFIEICLDENQDVWIMLHSGSRGIGNVMGRYFIGLAKKDMEQHIAQLPHKDLAYFTEGTKYFADYVEAVHWAQEYALFNRKEMMSLIVESLRKVLKPFDITNETINCHHNYVAVEEHFGEQVFLTRKGAIRAGLGELGIIPGSMGTKSYIVRGKGNPDSFCSCSHGAGRKMSRTAAKKQFSHRDMEIQTQGVECRKDKGVVDEIPGAYKSIDEVMQNQNDLVEAVHTLKQVVCVKG
ncbi:MAG: RtcB family protein [Candidatus Marithrix sp.]